MIKTKIANVWCIENNKLTNQRRYISTIQYRDLEINFLKIYNEEELIPYVIKDKNNVYWNLSIIYINLNSFKQVVLNNAKGLEKEYCDNIYQQLKKFDFEEYFLGKIKLNRYFNKCELEYILQFHKELYEAALKSRNMVIEQNRKQDEDRKKEQKEEEKRKVLETNQKFQEDYRKTLDSIIFDDYTNSINFEFYKDNKYENGKTVQNCFLYLAKKYGINIPLATQGFINQRLIKYNFREGRYSFSRSKSNNGSTKIYEYFSQIYEKVKNEFENKQVVKK